VLIEEGLQMTAIEVRPFRRGDRDQLTRLVNAHVQAVVPGLGVSVATLLSSLERDPGEYIIDPWVRDRVTLVAEQNDRIMAAAHLRRYHAGERVTEAYRNLGEIRWLLFWPVAADSGGTGPDGTQAAGQLIAACIGAFEEWAVTGQEADGTLPAPGVYGVPEQWPHVRDLYQRAGFACAGQTEVVYLARIEDLARPAEPPVGGLSVRRSVGINGTRLSAILGAEVAGYIEVEIFEGGERLARHGGWADIGNLHVSEPYRRRGVATWLLGQAADWLELAHVDRLLDYQALEPDTDAAACQAFSAAVGFREVTRTRRLWIRQGPGVSG
jgi:GNAT superfamily N-acetyltransferase